MASGAEPVLRRLGLISPVVQLHGEAECLDAPVMGRIARDEGHPVGDGDGGNHRVDAADGLAGSLQVGINSARKLGARLVESEHLLGRQGGEEPLNSGLSLTLVVASNDLDDGERGEGITAERAR